MESFFDITTARQNQRIYKWLENVTDTKLINSQAVFQNFCKGVKDTLLEIDTEMFEDEQMFNIYNEIKNKSIYLVDFIKKNKVKLDSKQRSKYFVESKKINSNDYARLDTILNDLIK